MMESEYLKLRGEIERQYAFDLDALNRVWTLLYPGIGFPVAEKKCVDASENNDAELSPAIARPAKSSVSTKAITATMEKALDVVDGDFTWKLLQLAANGHGANLKKSTLSQFLRRKANAGYIQVVKDGAGRRPTLYRKKGTDHRRREGFFE